LFSGFGACSDGGMEIWEYTDGVHAKLSFVKIQDRIFYDKKREYREDAYTFFE
jgi:hypothetical protein